MKLRLRIAAATVAATVPMVIALVIADARARQHAAEQELYRFTSERLEDPGERERCERGQLSHEGPRDAAGPGRGPPPHRGPPDGPPPPPPGEGPPPERMRQGPDDRFGRHREPARLYGYDAQGRAIDADAPVLAAAEIAGLADAAMVSRSTLWNAGEVEIVLRAPWPGSRCAIVVARGTKEPWLGAILPPTRVWLAPIAVVLLAVVLAVGPFVRRIRRLTTAVERQAAAGYAEGEAPRPSGGDEVDALARAFAAAGREVQAQLAAKDRRERALREFLDDTTHDVMIPLTVLQGHLATLRDGGTDAPLDRATLGAAMQESHYIGSLLHNLAIAAKLDTERPELQRAPVDLGALVERVAARHRPISAQLGVALEHTVPEPPRWAHADVTLLEQALGNLVYNAIRHNRAGGHVAVFVDDVAPDRFVLHVLDDGPGIAAAELDAVRERGVRGDAARTRGTGGRGLGLDIATRVCELHGYALRMAAASGGGLHVEVEGPRIEPGR
ncbi:MAG: HAMP domain-containing histidine kinase [Nannocystaceae bacterium]|nr:HAMP domain-containing histidine kinase [Nannocystaceae bacterium]